MAGLTKIAWRSIVSLPMVLIGAGGLFASVVAWHMTVAAEDRAFEQDFQMRSFNAANFLRERITDYWEKLDAVRALFESSSQPVSRDTFENFSRSLLQNHSAILNVAWVPRVKRADRAAHEQAAQADGLVNYRIRKTGPDQTLPVAPDRDEYFPKFYSTEPRSARVYGLDLNDDGGPRMKTVARIRDNNVLSISEPLVLHIGQGTRYGFWAGVPVYARGLPHETVEQRRENFVGIVQGVFQIETMFSAILGSIRVPLRTYVFLPDAVPSDRPIYTNSLRTGEQGKPETMAELTNSLHRSLPLDIGDARWTMILRPTLQIGFFDLHRNSTIVGLIGAIMTLATLLFVGTLNRKTAAVRAREALLAVANALLTAATEGSPDAILVVDEKGKITSYNRRFVDAWRIPQEMVESGNDGPVLERVVSQVKDRASFLARVKYLYAHQTESGQDRLELTDGRVFDRHTRALYGPNHTYLGRIWFFRDITEQEVAKEKIVELARTDSLTGLVNRRTFSERLEHEFSTARRTATAFAVFYLDIDYFKTVNDTLGHGVGDEVLTAVAQRIKNCVRETDLVGRFGGDEFAILQTNVGDISDAGTLAQKIRAALAAPLQVSGSTLHLTASIGISIYAPEVEKPADLLSQADVALYRAKEEGRDQYRFHSEALDIEVREHVALSDELRSAIERDELDLYYQPQVELSTNRIVGMEALLRWKHPTRGLLLPGVFLGVAERSGMMKAIGQWVLERACRQMSVWRKLGIAPPSIGVNLSLAQVGTAEEFEASVTDTLAKWGVRPSELEFDVTDLMLTRMTAAQTDALRRVRQTGVRIAIDDFGTRSSTLEYLRTYRVSCIKIPRQLVSAAVKEPDSAAMLRAIAGIARELDIDVVAQGVETEAQWSHLTAATPVKNVQGFFYSKPVPAERAEELLKRGNITPLDMWQQGAVA